MFGVGPLELAVIVIVAIVVFGPERLPEFARQAGRFVREAKKMANAAQTQLREELGPEYADLKLTDLDPRVAIRKAINEAMEDDVDIKPLPVAKGQQPLAGNERPPFDPDST
jgi:sec-independent protein translocase protein TatB